MSPEHTRGSKRHAGLSQTEPAPKLRDSETPQRRTKSGRRGLKHSFERTAQSAFASGTHRLALIVTGPSDRPGRVRGILQGFPQDCQHLKQHRKPEEPPRREETGEMGQPRAVGFPGRGPRPDRGHEGRTGDAHRTSGGWFTARCARVHFLAVQMRPDNARCLRAGKPGEGDGALRAVSATFL